MNKDEKFEQLNDLQEELRHARWEYWRDHVVFDWRWWLLLIAFAAFIAAWVFFSKRSLRTESLLLGGWTLALVLFLDVLGGELVLWHYPAMLLPWGARMVCIDAMIAISYMLLFQWFRHWKTHAVALVTMAALFAFVLEPLTKTMNIYAPAEWKNYYSFPIYIAIGLLMRWFTLRVTSGKKRTATG